MCRTKAKFQRKNRVKLKNIRTDHYEYSWSTRKDCSGRKIKHREAEERAEDETLVNDTHKVNNREWTIWVKDRFGGHKESQGRAGLVKLKSFIWPEYIYIYIKSCRETDIYKNSWAKNHWVIYQLNYEWWALGELCSRKSDCRSLNVYGVENFWE